MDEVPLREYIDTLFASYLRSDEQADRERVRSADALAGALSRSIAEGDDRLREHIANQVEQIKATLQATEQLGVERTRKMESESLLERQQLDRRFTAMVEIREQRFESMKLAVDKAEAATDKRFDSVNAFRAQLADQTSAFLPREVAETQFAEIRKLTADNTDRLNKGEGRYSGATDLRAQFVASAAVVVALGSLIAVLFHA